METVGVETDAPLETGSGPATPPGDNACNDYARGLAEAYAILARARGDVVVEDDDVVAMDGGSPCLFLNVAVIRRPLSTEGWREVATRLGRFYGERAGGDYLIFSPWPTADLAGAGFALVGHPPLMLRAPGPVPIDPVPGLEIRPVDDAVSAQDWESTLVAGFPLEGLEPYRPGCLLGPTPPAPGGGEGWAQWVAYLDGAPVAGAAAYVTATHVDVELVATLEAARGRGIGRAITATATSATIDRPAMLLASDPGRPVYERLGYRAVLRYTLWAGHRGTRGDGRHGQG